MEQTKDCGCRCHKDFKTCSTCCEIRYEIMKELVEKIEGKIREPDQIDKSGYHHDNGYNQALGEIIELIKNK